MERKFQIPGSTPIACRLLCRDVHNIQNLVIFCHGFGGSKENAMATRLADRLLTKYPGWALLAFDLPCHGEDVRKKLVFSQCREDLCRVLDYARETLHPEALYACGVSFGGFLLLSHIAEQGCPFRKVVLRCPAVNLFDILTKTILSPEDLENLRRGKRVSIGFERKIPVTPEFLEEIRRADVSGQDYLDWAERILVLHGTADDTVPMAGVQTFCDNQLIDFLPVAGADHRFRKPEHMEFAIQNTLRFFMTPD